MIKHNIKFNEGKTGIALDRQEIVSMCEALEPYAIGIALNIPDFELPGFIKNQLNVVEEKRQTVKAKPHLVVQNASPEKENATSQPKQKDNVYSLADYRNKSAGKLKHNS